MASPTEKDSKTMPTQKTFKRRVRTRMAKTGESYTAARHQLLKKAQLPAEPGTETPPPDDSAVTPDADALLTSDASMVRGSGRGHVEWFALLDAWGATDRRHPEIATWLREAHGVDGWWAQNITVSYERARGMRARHQVTGGFSVGATRTVAADAERALSAFTDESVRAGWLPGAPMQPRPTRAALTARFDWSDPPSRVVVAVESKGDRKSTVSVAHEKLPDADAAERYKVAWRGWLVELKALLEAG